MVKNKKWIMSHNGQYWYNFPSADGLTTKGGWTSNPNEALVVIAMYKPHVTDFNLYTPLGVFQPVIAEVPTQN